jgi:peptidoglycan-associated lipoprotein
VSPATIEKGQSATLTWETTDANAVSIEAAGISNETLGAVQPNGTLQVTPFDSTTYTLYAKGPGGRESATARVTVTVPPPPPAVPGPSEDELFSRNMRDVYFDYDKWQIRPDQVATVQADAAFLSQHPSINLTVEGHCDERGSVEYNLALGVKRATTLREALVDAGVSPTNITTTSYGKEKPACTEHDESCWQENRRGHLTHE